MSPERERRLQELSEHWQDVSYLPGEQQGSCAAGCSNTGKYLFKDGKKYCFAHVVALRQKLSGGEIER